MDPEVLVVVKTMKRPRGSPVASVPSGIERRLICYRRPTVRAAAAGDGESPEAQQWLPGQECEEPEDRPEEDCTLDELLALGSGGAFYEYDFGDSCLHRLELVSRRPADEDTPPSRLIDGARRGLLEDSGGLPGYEAMMDALADRPIRTTPDTPHGWSA